LRWIDPLGLEQALGSIGIIRDSSGNIIGEVGLEAPGPFMDPIDYVAGLAGLLRSVGARAVAIAGEKATQCAIQSPLNISTHAAERMAQYSVNEKMVQAALRLGEPFWDPKHKTVNFILKEGFASGESLLVGQNPVTALITTVIKGTKLIRPRHVPIP
jgi:hypothetical protein